MVGGTSNLGGVPYCFAGISSTGGVVLWALRTTFKSNTWSSPSVVNMLMLHEYHRCCVVLGGGGGLAFDYGATRSRKAGGAMCLSYLAGTGLRN